MPGESLRVLTFNVHLLSPGMQGMEEGFDERRAKEIAEVLRLGEFDIIGLNEVWDEDSKDTLVSELKGTYPHYVEYVDVVGAATCWISPLCGLPLGPPVAISGEDSGLMIFSRFPFEPLTDHHYQSGDNRTSEGSDFGEIAYASFDKCHDDEPCCHCFDCCAAKGAVLARFRHDSGRVVDVVVTHTQADEGDDPGTLQKLREIRMRQIDLIRARNSLGPGPNGIAPLIDRTLDESPFSWSNREWLLLMGDLNFDGKGAVRDNVYDAAKLGDPASEQWTTNIGSLTAQAPPFASPGDAESAVGYALYDAWAETTSELDPGPTSGGAGGRLDYILASRRTGPNAAEERGLCVQHVWTPREFGGLSDHQALAADINVDGVQCNPRLAYDVAQNGALELDWIDGREGLKLHREIAAPGAMQWYRLDEPGGYAIALDPASVADGLALEVYPADDLSSPVGGAYELPETTLTACDYENGKPRDCREVPAQEFVLPTGPHYVRVFNRDRGKTGSYWVAFYRFTCKSREERCELMANQPSTMHFPPAGQPLNEKDRAWFRFRIVEQADAQGARQQLRLFARAIDGEPWYKPALHVLDAQGNELAAIDGDDLEAEQPVDPLAAVLRSSTQVDAELFLLVERGPPFPALSAEVGWQTDLVLAGGSQIAATVSQLVCEDETNDPTEIGKDEISLEVNVDGAGWVPAGHADFDCNTGGLAYVWDDEIGVIRYLSSLQFRVVEWDTGNDDDVSGVVPAPSWSLTQDAAGIAGYRNAFFEFKTGRYRFWYNLAKSRQN